MICEAYDRQRVCPRECLSHGVSMGELCRRDHGSRRGGCLKKICQTSGFRD
jgi:hypothetical protein